MINIDLNNLPHHIAFIIDGNGRWAKLRNKERRGLSYVIGQRQHKKYKK